MGCSRCGHVAKCWRGAWNRPEWRNEEEDCTLMVLRLIVWGRGVGDRCCEAQRLARRLGRGIVSGFELRQGRRGELALL